MAAVIGGPDEYHGEIVRAFVVLKHDRTTPLADLSAHCTRELAPYKVPRQIEIRSTLPMTGLGKVLYRVLREESAAQPATSL